MQPADDVKFRRALGYAFCRALVNLIQRERVSAGRVRRAAERAEAAMRHANIRGIDVAVDVVVADVSVFLFAHVIRKPAERKQIVRLIERDAVFRVTGARRRELSLRPARSRVSVILSSLIVCISNSQGRPTTVAAPQNNRNKKTNIAIHGEKRSIDFAQIVGFHERMLVDEQRCDHGNSRPRRPAKLKTPRQPREQSDHHDVHRARDRSAPATPNRFGIE